MTDQQPYQTPDSPDWRDQPPTTHRDSAPWGVGLILILIGGYLLLRNLNIALPFFLNWWALFILIPAISAFSNGWTEYRRAGRLTSLARGKMIAAFFLTVLAGALLFGISSTYFWPVILILGGISLLVNGLLPK